MCVHIHKFYVLLNPDADTDNREDIYERWYSKGYDIYNPQYYKWLKSTYPSYAEEWYHKVVIVQSSSQETILGASEVSTELEQSAMQDSSRSSIQLELAGDLDRNKDLKKYYTRRYEKGYNLFDPQYYTWLQRTHPSYAKIWYQTAVKMRSAPGEQESKVELSDMPGHSGLSSTVPPNDMELDRQSDDSENICMYTINYLFNCVIIHR